MAGGLMNISAYGNENIILHGNPKKTFFKASYNKHTNFGLQRFRINYKGTRTLNPNQKSIFNFKIPRYGDLIHDTYIVIDLPNIWSPFYFKSDNNRRDPKYEMIPYEFQWIKDLGSSMIDEVLITSGGVELSKISGEYLSVQAQRDLNTEKKALWNAMTGNIPALYNPSNVNNNLGVYPNAFYLNNDDIEPSIRGRKLYIPINSFFCNNSKLALPLVALQYQEIEVRIIFKPLYDLFTINDIKYEDMDNTGLSYRIRANPNDIDQQMYRFLQPPKQQIANAQSYSIPDDGVGNFWNPDIHLISTFIFLDESERRLLAQGEHRYLIKEIIQHDFLGQSGSKTVNIESRNLISSYMYRFRRSDVNLRNEWHNYSNWAYEDIVPQNISLNLLNNALNKIDGLNNPNNFYITGNIGNFAANKKEILQDLAISMGGVYRENQMDAGIYNYVEKYLRTSGNAKNGLYCYNFCLNSNIDEYQPSGGMNVNKFKYVSFEFNTIECPNSENQKLSDLICDNMGNPLGFRKTINTLKEYTFDLRVWEERYNMIIIKSGRIGLLNAK
jgi:hypothetical protein